MASIFDEKDKKTQGEIVFDNTNANQNRSIFDNYNLSNMKTNDDDSLLSALGYGVMGIPGQVIGDIGTSLKYLAKPASTTTEEWDKAHNDTSWASPYTLYNSMIKAGDYLRKPNDRLYEDNTLNQIAYGAGRLPASFLELWLASKGANVAIPQAQTFGEAAGAIGAAKLANTTLLKNSPKVANYVANKLPELAGAYGSAPLKAIPEATMEQQDAVRGYIEKAKANGTYKPGITEQEAEKVGQDVFNKNWMLLTATDPLDNALLLGKPATKIGKLANFGIDTTVGGLVNAGQENLQTNFPKMASGENWSLTDKDALVSSAVGFLGSGMHNAAGEVYHSIFDKKDSETNTTNEKTDLEKFAEWLDSQEFDEQTRARVDQILSDGSEEDIEALKKELNYTGQEAKQQTQQAPQTRFSARKTPIAEGIEDTGLYGTNNELKNGIDTLNGWVYNSFGKDMLVSGGARSKEHNAEVGGHPNSEHLYGEAVDLDISDFSEEERKQIEAKAKEAGFNTLYHDAGTGYHLHLGMPKSGAFNFESMGKAMSFVDMEDEVANLYGGNDYLAQQMAEIDKELAELNKKQDATADDFLRMNDLQNERQQMQAKIEENKGLIKEIEASQETSELDIDNADRTEIKARQNYTARQTNNITQKLKSNNKYLNNIQATIRKNKGKTTDKQKAAIERLTQENKDLIEKLRSHKERATNLQSVYDERYKAQDEAEAKARAEEEARKADPYYGKTFNELVDAMNNNRASMREANAELKKLQEELKAINEQGAKGDLVKANEITQKINDLNNAIAQVNGVNQQIGDTMDRRTFDSTNATEAHLKGRAKHLEGVQNKVRAKIASNNKQISSIQARGEKTKDEKALARQKEQIAALTKENEELTKSLEMPAQEAQKVAERLAKGDFVKVEKPKKAKVEATAKPAEKPVEQPTNEAKVEPKESVAESEKTAQKEPENTEKPYTLEDVKAELDRAVKLYENGSISKDEQKAQFSKIQKKCVEAKLEGYGSLFVEAVKRAEKIDKANESAKNFEDRAEELVNKVKGEEDTPVEEITIEDNPEYYKIKDGISKEYAQGLVARLKNAVRTNNIKDNDDIPNVFNILTGKDQLATEFEQYNLRDKVEYVKNAIEHFDKQLETMEDKAPVEEAKPVEKEPSPEEKQAVYEETKADERKAIISEADTNSEREKLALEKKKQAEKAIEDQLEPIIVELKKGVGNGITDRYVDAETGAEVDATDLRGKDETKEGSSIRHERFSNNDNWYSQFFAQYKRQPTKADYLMVAEEMARGKGGWSPDSQAVRDAAGTFDNQGGAEAAKANSEVLDYLHDMVQIYTELAEEFKAGQEKEKPKNVSDENKTEKPAVEEAKPEPKAPVKDKNENPVEEAKRFDKERAKQGLAGKLKKKAKNAEPQANDAIKIPKFDIDENELDSLLKDVNKIINRVNSNVMFDPELAVKMFKIGVIYIKKGFNTFADWSNIMLKGIPNGKPFLKATWNSIKGYKSDVLDGETLSAIVDYVGAELDDGKSIEQIKKDLADEYEDDLTAYIDSAYIYYKDYPSALEENVVESNVEKTSNYTDENGKVDYGLTPEGMGARNDFLDRTEQETDKFVSPLVKDIKDGFLSKEEALKRLVDYYSELKENISSDDVTTLKELERMHELNAVTIGRTLTPREERKSDRESMLRDLREKLFNKDFRFGTYDDSASGDKQYWTTVKFPIKDKPALNRMMKEYNAFLYEVAGEKIVVFRDDAENTFSNKFREDFINGTLKNASAFGIDLKVEKQIRLALGENNNTTKEATQNATDRSGETGDNADSQGTGGGEGELRERDNNGLARAGADRQTDTGLEKTKTENVQASAKNGDTEGEGDDGSSVPKQNPGKTDESGNVHNGRKGTSVSASSSVGGGSGRADRGTGTVEGTAHVKQNYHIDDPNALLGGTPKVRFLRNQKAIEAVKAITDEGRDATEEEKAVMAAYSGWGSFGQELFQGTWERPIYKDGWKAENDWLRNHLGKEEWESAQKSIINAHYTDPITVKSMWDMISKMGFKGGRILEPSMGVGNFFALMPKEIMANSTLTGIELDTTTGKMAQALYPNANIQIKGYQDSKTADNFYDLIIGNVPFHAVGPSDRRYNKFNPTLHDYFFLKGLDQLRPGGLMVAITSKGTMDKADRKVRGEMAKKAELVAAFRLPTGAFDNFAGTSVVTDILIFKKRENELGNEALTEPWVDANKQVVRFKFQDHNLYTNNYFKLNPDNVLGKVGFGHGTTTNAPGLLVERQPDFQEKLENLKDRLEEGVYKPQERKEDTHYLSNHTNAQQGSVVAQSKGLYVVQGDVLVPLNSIKSYSVKSDRTTKDREKAIGMLADLRDILGKVIDADNNGDGNAEELRKELNKSYGKFTSIYGPVKKSWALGYLEKIGEPSANLLGALEDSSGNKVGIFKHSTVRAIEKPKNPSIEDAFIYNRNNSTSVDIETIAKDANSTPEEVAKKLIADGMVFKTPAGNYETKDQYLSGNVRIKLREAQDALNSGDKDMEHNVEELKKVIPATVPYYNIEANLGASWIDPQYYKRFIADKLGLSKPDGISLAQANGGWVVKFDNRALDYTPLARSLSYGDVKFSKILEKAFNHQTITIKAKDDEGNEYVDKEASEKAQAKVDEIVENFKDWLWQDNDRKVQLEKDYNEAMNAIATPKYDGSFMQMSGMALLRGNNEFSLRTHQSNAIYRGIVNGRGIYAHEVGTGKTYTMGGLAIESRKYGLAKKPLILAHNANSNQVYKEIQEMYPGKKILYIDNLDKATIKKKLEQIKVDDWDAIVIPHSQMEKLTLKEETLMRFAADEIAELEDMAIAAAEEEGEKLTREKIQEIEEENLKPNGKKGIPIHNPTAKKLVGQRNKIIENIRKQAAKSSAEDAISFEDLGIDMIIVDEAHVFKKPPFSTKMSMKGLNNSNSQAGIRLNFLCRYVQSLNNGKGVHLFTGTPITNTLAEMFHMMRYVMPNELKEAGVYDFDRWFNVFAAETNDLAITSSGEYENESRLASFTNVAELRRMAGNVMDIVFADDMPEFKPRETESGKTLDSKDLTDKERDELLNGRTENAIGRPYKKIVNIEIPLDSNQKGILSYLVNLAKEWKQAGKEQRKEWMKHGDEHSPLLVETAANNAGLDARLYNPNITDDGTAKEAQCVKNVIEIFRQGDKEHPAVQAIFMERGFSNSSTKTLTNPDGTKSKIKVDRFNMAKSLKEKIAKEGAKYGLTEDKIVIIDGTVKAETKAELAEKLAKGELYVVIGSTQTLGTGVNMQANLRAMHHLDAPWTPAELEQRNGRGHRQGNKWNTVLELRYLAEKLDGKRWQVLSIKQKFIKMFMKADENLRTIEGDAVDMQEGEGGSDLQETLSKAAGDPRIMLKAKYEGDIKKLQQKERIFVNGIADTKQRIKETERTIEVESRAIPERQKDADTYNAHKDEPFEIKLATTLKPGFTGRQTFDKMGEANDHLQKILREIPVTASPMPLGTFKGFNLRVVKNVAPIKAALDNKEAYQYDIYIEGEAHPFMAKDSVMSIAAVLRNQAEARLTETVDKINKLKEQLEIMKKNVDSDFPQKESLEKRKKLLADLEADLKENPTPAPQWLIQGSPVDNDVYYQGEHYVVTGHKANNDGFYVTGINDNGKTVNIPYQEAKDEHNMDLYDALQHGFSPEYGTGSNNSNARDVSVPYNRNTLNEDGSNDIIQVANNCYDKILKKYKEIANGSERVKNLVKDAIRATINFGQYEGEIEVASGGKGVFDETSGGNNESNDLGRLSDNSIQQKKRVSKTLGIGITRELVNEGAFSLVGKKVNSPQELAEIAQVLRHPGYEKFHKIYVNDKGIIVDHETHTAMLPSEVGYADRQSTADMLMRMFENKARNGATKVYFIHNHPSGNPQASSDDFKSTNDLLGFLGRVNGADVLDNKKIDFAGHIILDTTKYGLIDTKGKFSEGDIPDDKQIKYDQIGIAHSALGKDISTPDAVASTIKHLNNDSDTTVFFTTSQNIIRAVVKLPKEINAFNKEKLNRYLRLLARKHYSAKAFVVTSDQAVYEASKSLLDERKGVTEAVLVHDRKIDRSADYEYQNSELGKRNRAKAEKEGRVDDVNFFGLEGANTNSKVLRDNVKQYNSTYVSDLKRAAERIVPIKTEKVYRDTQDEYDSHAKVGLIHNNGDTTSLAGIVGMHIDREKGITRANKTARNEILAKATANAQASLEGEELGKFYGLSDSAKIKRGVAAFMRAYARDKKQAQQEYPAYFSAFEKMLAMPSNKVLKDKVDNFVDTVQKYEGMTEEGKARASKSKPKANPTLWDKIVNALGYSKWFDDKDSINDFTKKYIEATQKAIEDEDNPYYQARLASTTVTNRVTALLAGPQGKQSRDTLWDMLNSFYDNVLKNKVFFSDVIAKANELNKKMEGDSLEAKRLKNYLTNHKFRDWNDALGTYLLANRFLEIWKTKPNYTASMTQAQAKRMVDFAPKEIKEAAELYYKFDEDLLRIMKHDGLLSQEAYDALTKYKAYCPLFRDFADDEAYDKYMERLGDRNGFANISNGIKYLTEGGSDRTVMDDPVISMMRMTGAIISKCERNKVSQKLVALTKESGIGEFAMPAYDAEGNQLHSPNAQESRFTVYEDGVKNAYRTTPELYKALTGNIDYGELVTNLVEFLSIPSKALRFGSTSTPGFMANNALMDTATGWVFSHNNFIPVYGTLHGMYLLTNDEKTTAEYKLSGAAMGTWRYQDRTQEFETLDEMAGRDPAWYDKNEFTKLIAPIHKYFMKGFNKYLELGELIENSNRIEEFYRARQNGKSTIRAALEAKEITTDFTRGGEYGRVYNRITPFFNARLQGLDQLVRNIKERPAEIIPKMAILMLMAAVYWSRYHDEDWWKEKSNEEKMSAMFLPYKDEKGQIKMARLPYPHELGLISSGLMIMALEKMNGDNPNIGKNFAQQLILQTSPAMMPAFFRPMIEVQANYDLYFNSPIETKKDEQFLKEARIGSTTSKVSIVSGKASKVLTDVTGGIVPQLSPKEFEHLYRGYVGDAGRILIHALDDEQPGDQWLGMPILGPMAETVRKRFVKKGFDHPKSVDDWYNLKTELEQYNNTHLKGQKPAYMQGVNNVHKAINKINKQINAIRTSNLPEDRKQELIYKLNVESSKIARIGLKTFSKYKQ